MVQICLVDNFFLEINNLDQIWMSKICSLFTFFDRNAKHVPSYKSGLWDGNVRLYSYNKKSRKYRFYRGFLKEIINFFKKENIHFELLGFEKGVISSVGLSDFLMEHQIQAVKSFCEQPFGILKIPTRGGKTIILGELLRKYFENNDKKVLIIVDTIDLFNQMIEDIVEWYPFLQSKIGVIKESKNQIYQNIIVSTIQTLTRKDHSFIKELADKIDFLVIDEIHEYSSEQRRNFIINNFVNTRFFLSLSATPYRKNESEFIKNMYLKGYTGDIIFESSYSDLLYHDVLTQYKLCIISYNHQKKEKRYDQSYTQFFRQKIIKNVERNDLIINLINLLKRLKLKTLFIFTSKEHGDIISQKTNIPFISGDDNSKRRENVKHGFLNNNEEYILLASNIYKKGVTLPAVEVFVNVNGGKEQTSIIQKKGRILAKTKDKSKSLVIDIFDDCQYFDEHSTERLKVYMDDLKDENIEILEYCDGMFLELSNILKIWFYDSRR